MRTIKFRAKDLASNKWLYGDLRHHKDDICIFKQEGNNGKQVKRETVGQFTGLYDDNLKEIYEGDIVEVTEFGVQNGKKIIALIVYDEDLGCFNFKASDRERCMCVSIPYIVIKIIGNIHDNPNLITFKTNYNGH